MTGARATAGRTLRGLIKLTHDPRRQGVLAVERRIKAALAGGQA